MYHQNLVRNRLMSVAGLFAGALVLNGCVSMTVFDGSDGNSDHMASTFSASDAYVEYESIPADDTIQTASIPKPASPDVVITPTSASLAD